jgi:hypothetical protein
MTTVMTSVVMTTGVMTTGATWSRNNSWSQTR